MLTAPIGKTGIGSQFRTLVEENRKQLQRIQNLNVFTFDFVPDEPIWRPEMDSLLRDLALYVNADMPSHHCIVGGRGTGKTLFAQYLARLLPKEYGLNVLFVNCRQYETTHKAIACMLGREPRGYSRGEYYEEFSRRFPSKTLVILDEADSISRKDDPNKEIFYFLSRQTRCATLSLSNNLMFARTLDQSIQTTLQPQTISFPPYSPSTIVQILRQRAELGLMFEPPESVLSHLAHLTHYKVNGDLRIAIKSLLLWAMSPERDVQACFQQAKEEIYYDVLKNLNQHHLAILEVVAAKRDLPAREIYRRYREGFDGAPYSYVTFYDAIDLLATADLIRLEWTRVRNAETRKASLKFDRFILDRFLAAARKQREYPLQQTPPTGEADSASDDSLAHEITE